jgi:hypothetical protein
MDQEQTFLLNILNLKNYNNLIRRINDFYEIGDLNFVIDFCKKKNQFELSEIFIYGNYLLTEYGNMLSAVSLDKIIDFTNLSYKYISETQNLERFLKKQMDIYSVNFNLIK